MPAIVQLCDKILQSPAFRVRFKTLERAACEKRMLGTQPQPRRDDIRTLLMQSSVLAFGENREHKRTAQKINALIRELYPDELLVSYAIQVIAARLGNYPVVSPDSRVFRDDNLFSQINSDNSSDTVIDLDLTTGFLQEEELSRYTIRETNYHFNVYQTEILEALARMRLVSFSAPTSFGKSFIVRHFIAQQYAAGRLGNCLIIVPTKSLIDDYFEDLAALKRRLSLNYSLFTHTRSVDQVTRESIFILTQERLAYLLNNNPDVIQSFNLVYCDEAHYIARGYRGFLLRNVLKRLISICEARNVSQSRTKYIFSSPIIKNPHYYHRKLFQEIPEDQVFHKEIQYSPVEKNIHLIMRSPGRATFHLLHEKLDGESFESRTELIGEDLLFPEDSGGANATSIERDISIVRGLNLHGGTICYSTSPLKAHIYGQELASQLAEKDGQFVDDINDLQRYVRDHFDDSFGLIELLKKGVGLHYGPMPVGLRQAIVNLFEKGVIDYLVCTSTLLEGVNLPAKNIILFSDKFGGSGGKEKHNSLSFWNLLGRAGRITYGLSGNVFCIHEKVDGYKSLLESEEAEILDPEIGVLEKKIPQNYFLKSFLGTSEEKYSYVKAQSRDDIEYLIFELLTSDHPEHLLAGLNIDESDRKSVFVAISEIRSGFSIPTDLINSNPGIDPRLQNDLYLFLSTQENDQLLLYYSNISNLRSITGPKIYSILEATEQYLKWPLKDTLKISNRLTQWLMEFSISEFVQQSIRYIDTQQNLDRIERAIKIIRTIETDCSYSAPKYLKCFFDIAGQIAIDKEITSIYISPEKVDNFLFAIESGISSVIGRYLFERGVSRPVAIKASSLVDDLITIPIPDDFFERPDIATRLREGLSKIALGEISRHLQIEI